MNEISPEDEKELGICVFVAWKAPVRVKVYRDDKTPIGTVFNLMVIHEHHDRIHGFGLTNRQGFEGARDVAVALVQCMHGLSVWPDDEGFERIVLEAFKTGEPN